MMCAKFMGEERRGSPCCQELTETKHELYALKSKVIYYLGGVAVIAVLTGTLFIPQIKEWNARLARIAEKQTKISTQVDYIQEDLREVKDEIKNRYGYLKKKHN